MIRRTIEYCILFSLTISSIKQAKATMFDTHFVEMDTSKMVHTSESHYAISGPNLPDSWKAVSVNQNEISAVSSNNKLISKKLSDLSQTEKHLLNSAKETLTTVIRNGPFNVKSKTGFVKLTAFDRNGGTSVTGVGGPGQSASSSSSSSSSASSSSSNGMSISRTGKRAYIVTKSDFALNWQRVFVNDDLNTIVYKDGKVKMLLENLFDADEKAKLIALKQEVDKSSAIGASMANSMLKSINNPMDFVSKAMGGFGGMFG